MFLIKEAIYRIAIQKDPDRDLQTPESKTNIGFTFYNGFGTDYMKFDYDKKSDTEDDENQEEAPTVRTYAVDERLGVEPMNEDEVQDVLSVWNDMICDNPLLMKSSRKYFKICITKYMSYVPETNDVAYRLDYYFDDNLDKDTKRKR